MTELEGLYTNAESVPADPWLARWYDEGLEISDEWDIETLVGIERDRISRAFSVVMYAVTIPRRLGGDASREDLATDKRRCRRVGHALRQSYRGWDKHDLIPNTEDVVRQEGAQLIWDIFSAEHLVALSTRARFVVTWSVQAGHKRWGKSAATNFTNEHRWLSYALR